MIHNLLIGLHILAVIAWMAGLLYLPRLFAYHTRASPGSQMDETFTVMEAKLASMIMRPAMIAVLILGGTLIWYDADRLGWGLRFLLTPWMLTKLAGVAFLIWWHHFLLAERRAIAERRSTRTERFWRMTNEAPFLAAIVVVLAATTKFG
ncbi:MAG TPA: CopD family protein [Caulobacteraceae bacterium]